MTAIERYGPSVAAFLVVAWVASRSVRSYGAAPAGSTRFDLSKADLLRHACIVIGSVAATSFLVRISPFGLGAFGTVCAGVGVVRHRLRTNATFIWQWDVVPPTRNERLWMLYGFFLAFIALLPIWPATYAGDGVLTDNGPLAATDRYVLDLGTIDLSSMNTRTFRLVNLPPENFGCGIKLTAAPGHKLVGREDVGASVSMEIVGETNEVLMHVSKPLRGWAWEQWVNDSTVAFLYVQGPGGSFFDPRERGSYRLNVAVLSPGPRSDFQATVVLKSGGWK